MPIEVFHRELLRQLQLGLLEQLQLQQQCFALGDLTTMEVLVDLEVFIVEDQEEFLEDWVVIVEDQEEFLEDLEVLEDWAVVEDEEEDLAVMVDQVVVKDKCMHQAALSKFRSFNKEVIERLPK
jgi:hypothetical protein